ncbi:MAG: gliding motility-associated C-terminal domain-containing protein [Bacteroidota bacterium]
MQKIPGLFWVLWFSLGVWAIPGASWASNLTPGAISPANDTLCPYADPGPFVSQPATNAFGTVSYQWQIQPGCTGAWTDIPGANALTFDPASVENQALCYRLEITDDSCTVYSAIVSTFPHPAEPPQLTPQGPTVGCEGDSVLFVASSSVNNSFNWLFNGQPIPGMIGDSLVGNQPGDYAVVITNSNGCQDTSQTFAYTWFPPLNTSILALLDSTICPGDTTPLQAQVVGNVSGFQWLQNGIPIPGATAANYSATETGTYTLQVVDNNGCTYTSPGREIVPGVPPSAQLFPPSATLICAGVSIPLTGSGGSTYQWLRDGLPILGATDSVLAATASGEYALVADNGCGSDTTPAITMLASPGPTAAFDYENYLLSQVLFFDESTDAVHWSWDLGNLVSPEQFVYYAFPGPGSYEVTLTVTDLLGCTNATTQTVTVTDPDPFVPNVFTPNDDGINDEARTRFDRLNAIDFCIFDRWGSKVFTTRSPNEFWDGRIGEQRAPEGVYYFSLRALDIRGKSIVASGNITLLR